jgi:hypothetical protein
VYDAAASVCPSKRVKASDIGYASLWLQHPTSVYIEGSCGYRDGVVWLERFYISEILGILANGRTINKNRHFISFNSERLHLKPQSKRNMKESRSALAKVWVWDF